jgi:hypothetical protein
MRASTAALVTDGVKAKKISNLATGAKKEPTADTFENVTTEARDFWVAHAFKLGHALLDERANVLVEALCDLVAATHEDLPPRKHHNGTVSLIKKSKKLKKTPNSHTP